MPEKNNGAKAKMAFRQKRGTYECVECGDEVALAYCGICNELICKTCRLDHNCANGPNIEQVVSKYKR